VATTFNTLDALKATEFQVAIFEDIDFNSFADQRDRGPYCVRSRSLYEEMKTSLVEQPHCGEKS
jgi:hypothetical protein